MAQTLRPVASTVGNYTIVPSGTAHGVVDESVLDTADYVQSPAGPDDEAIRFVLEDAIDPESTGSHVIHVVAAKSQAGGAQINLTIELIGKSTGGDVVHASVTHPNIGETPTDYTLTLTVAQINAIPALDYTGDTADQSDLDVRCTFTQV